jgi:hypothetical protein
VTTKAILSELAATEAAALTAYSEMLKHLTDDDGTLDTTAVTATLQAAGLGSGKLRDDIIRIAGGSILV